MQGFGCLPHEIIQPHRARFVFAFAGIPQKLRSQIGAAAHHFFNVQQNPVLGVGWLHVEQRQRHIALDRHQQIVEIVRNAAGESADGLHFLGLLKLTGQAFALLLGSHLFGDVFAEYGQLGDLASLVAYRVDGGGVGTPIPLVLEVQGLPRVDDFEPFCSATSLTCAGRKSTSGFPNSSSARFPIRLRACSFAARTTPWASVKTAHSTAAFNKTRVVSSHLRSASSFSRRSFIFLRVA